MTTFNNLNHIVCSLVHCFSLLKSLLLNALQMDDSEADTQRMGTSHEIQTGVYSEYQIQI